MIFVGRYLSTLDVKICISKTVQDTNVFVEYNIVEIGMIIQNLV